MAKKRRKPKVKVYKYSAEDLERMKNQPNGVGNVTRRPSSKVVKLSDGSVTYVSLRVE